MVRYLDSTSDAAKARMHGTWFSFMDELSGLVMVTKSAFQKQNYITPVLRHRHFLCNLRTYHRGGNIGMERKGAETIGVSAAGPKKTRERAGLFR